jgi:hypothetical protein
MTSIEIKVWTDAQGFPFLFFFQNIFDVFLQIKICLNIIFVPVNSRFFCFSYCIFFLANSSMYVQIFLF